MWLAVVGMLWGCTTPLMKRGSRGVGGSAATSSSSATAMATLRTLAGRWRYVVPFAVNQLGSVVFYWRLSASDVSLVGPVANGLAFLFTALVGSVLGEQRLSASSAIGALLILAGTALCAFAKQGR